MPFLGNIINFVAVALFASLGALIKKGIPERISRAILSAVAIAVIYVGISGALEPSTGYLDTVFNDSGLTKFIIMIVSLALGTALGELIDIDKWITRLGAKLEKRFGAEESGKGNFAKGFVSCTVMISVGAMAINGAILDAVGDPSVLIAKSVIDAISCFVLASSLGFGCAFSAIPMLLYQGGLCALALLFSAVIPTESIYYLSVTGSLIIVIIGTNLLGITNVKTANMTPALFIPLVIVPILKLI